MVHSEEREDGLHVHISRKTVAAVLLTLLTAVFGAIGYPIVSMVTPARHDPYTGTQGRALEAKVKTLEDELAEHRKNAEQWKYRIIALEEKLKK